MPHDWEARIQKVFTGVRNTAQRRAIVQTVLETTEHFTADDLLRMARERDSSISRATVYRTLILLVENGLLKELDLGKAQTYYDPNYAEHPHHNHLICEDCDKIVEFEDPIIEEREEKISRELGFEPKNKSVQIRATCSRLKSSGSCENKKSCHGP